MGPQGNLRRLSCQYRGMDIPGRPITARGIVTDKYESGGEYLVNCELWLENEQGQRTTPGRRHRVAAPGLTNHRAALRWIPNANCAKVSPQPAPIPAGNRAENS